MTRLQVRIVDESAPRLAVRTESRHVSLCAFTLPSPVHTIAAAATSWLHQHLGEVGGSAPSASIRQAGREAGFSTPQLAEARRRLNVSVHTLSGWLGLIRFGGHLPKGGYDVPTNGRDPQAPATPAI
jgi:hypothetical protein